jgi:hypothetical protein
MEEDQRKQGYYVVFLVVLTVSWEGPRSRAATQAYGPSLSRHYAPTAPPKPIATWHCLRLLLLLRQQCLILLTTTIQLDFDLIKITKPTSSLFLLLLLIDQSLPEPIRLIIWISLLGDLYRVIY